MSTFPDVSSARYIPIVCVSASQAITEGAERRTSGFTYIQGSGDDHELWGMVSHVLSLYPSFHSPQGKHITPPHRFTKTVGHSLPSHDKFPSQGYLSPMEPIALYSYFSIGGWQCPLLIPLVCGVRLVGVNDAHRQTPMLGFEYGR